MSLEFLQDNLIEALSSQLSSLNDKDLSRFTVVLPTQRLSLQLDLKLSKDLGAYLPPRFFTLENYLNHLCEQTSNQKLPDLLDKISLSFLIPSILKEKRFKTIFAFNVDSYLQILENLYNSPVSDNIGSALQAALQLDAHRHEKYQQFIAEKNNEILELDKAISEYGAKNSCLPYYQWPAVRCQTLKEATIQEKTWVAGLSTIRYQDAKVLSRFEKQPTVRLLFHQRQPSITPISVKNLLFQEADSDLPASNPMSRSKTYLTRCSSPLAEVENALSLATKFIDTNTPDNQIYIGVTNESFYKSYLTSELEKYSKNFGLKYNLALGEKISDLGPGFFLRAFALFVEAEDLQKADFLCLAESLENRTSNGYGKFKSVRYLKDLRELLSGKAPIFEIATAKASPQDHCSQLREILDEYSIVENLAHSDIETKAWQSFYRLLADVEQNPLLRRELYTLTEFLALLIKHCQTTELHHKGSSFSGIQILRLSELRWIPAQVVILLGCQESDLPAIHIDESVLDLSTQHKLELPIPETLEKLEFLHLELLRENAQSLFLSYSATIQDLEQSPASICHLWLANKECKRLACQPSHKLGASEVVHEADESTPERLATNTTPPQLSYRQPIEKLSAKSAQSLLSCPLRFALERSRTDTFETAENLKNREVGIYLHQVLSVFFSSQLRGRQVIPLWSEANPANYHHYFLERLNLALEKTAALGSSAGSSSTSSSANKLLPDSMTVQLQKHSFPKLSRFLKSLFPEKDYSVISRCISEVSLQDFDASFEVGDYRFKMVGQVDLVNLNGLAPVLLDFKKSSVPSTADLNNQLDIQLSFYALALQGYGKSRGESDERSEKESWRIFEPLQLGYWNILRGEWTHAFSLDDTSQYRYGAYAEKGKKSAEKGKKSAEKGKKSAEKGKKSAEKGKKSAEPFIDSFKTTLHKRLSRLDEARYFEAHDDHCGFCSYQSICRKKDPRFIGYFSEIQKKKSQGEV